MSKLILIVCLFSLVMGPLIVHGGFVKRFDNGVVVHGHVIPNPQNPSGQVGVRIPFRKRDLEKQVQVKQQDIENQSFIIDDKNESYMWFGYLI